jgi:hypothetical protein
LLSSTYVTVATSFDLWYRECLYRGRRSERRKEKQRSREQERETQKKRGGGHDSHSDGYDVCDFSGD